MNASIPFLVSAAVSDQTGVRVKAATFFASSPEEAVGMHVLELMRNPTRGLSTLVDVSVIKLSEGLSLLASAQKQTEE